MRLEAAIWWRMGIKAGKIDILAKRFIRLRDDMSRKSVYFGCAILMILAISTASAQDGASLNNASDKSKQNMTVICEESAVSLECDEINKPPTIIVGGAKSASCGKLIFSITGEGKELLQEANCAGLPAETVMDLSGAINIRSSNTPFGIGGDGKEMLQQAFKERLPAETVMGLSATVLPRYKIRNIN